MRDRTDRAIGRVALALSAVVVLAVAITGWLALRARPSATPAYRAGDVVDLPKRYFESHDTTVVIVVRSGCPACDRSAAFHQALQDTARAAGVGVEWIRAEHALPAELGRLHVVPSVLWLDRRGVVLEMKEGALPDDEQRALIARVRGGPGT